MDRAGSVPDFKQITDHSLCTGPPKTTPSRLAAAFQAPGWGLRQDGLASFQDFFLSLDGFSCMMFEISEAFHYHDLAGQCVANLP